MLFTQSNWDDALEVTSQEFYEDRMGAGITVGEAEGVELTRKVFTFTLIPTIGIVTFALRAPCSLMLIFCNIYCPPRLCQIVI